MPEYRDFSYYIDAEGSRRIDKERQKKPQLPAGNGENFQISAVDKHMYKVDPETQSGKFGKNFYSVFAFRDFLIKRQIFEKDKDRRGKEDRMKIEISEEKFIDLSVASRKEPCSEITQKYRKNSQKIDNIPFLF